MRLPWQRGAKNQALLGRLSTSAPDIAKIVARAGNIEHGWITAEYAAAKAAEEAAAAKRKKAEVMLHGG